MQTALIAASATPHPPSTIDSLASRRAGRPPGSGLVWMYRNARALHPERRLSDLRRRAELFIRQLALHGQLRAWRGPELALLRDMLTWRPALVSVVSRPYISTGWGPARRLTAVEEHYRQLGGLGRCLQFALRPEASLRLATVRSGPSVVDLVLDSPSWFIHEGEVCLNLFQGGERIYTLAFSLGFDRGEPVAWVGALQGRRCDRSLDRYRAITHDLHGLRPRDLLIGAFRQVCASLGLARWLAVGDGRRVSASDYFRAGLELHSHYDDAWALHGGNLRPDGFHDMPLRLARRTETQMPSRKRSAYRQRYAMLDRLEAELAASLRRHGEPGAAAPAPRP